MTIEDSLTPEQRRQLKELESVADDAKSPDLPAPKQVFRTPTAEELATADDPPAALDRARAQAQQPPPPEMQPSSRPLSRIEFETIAEGDASDSQLLQMILQELITIRTTLETELGGSA